MCKGLTLVISLRTTGWRETGTSVMFCNGGHIAEFILYINKTNFTVVAAVIFAAKMTDN